MHVSACFKLVLVVLALETTLNLASGYDGLIPISANRNWSGSAITRGCSGTQLNALNEQVEKIEAFVENSSRSLHETMDRLGQELASQALALKKVGAQLVFDVSSPFRGKHYLLSKKAKSFRIAKADATCADYGGYLLELSDKAEYDFVFEFMQTVGTTEAAIGANDINLEGHFVNYHSNTPMAYSSWHQGEPNNSHDEDCVVMRTGKGMNDIPCHRHHFVKYICEVVL